MYDNCSLPAEALNPSTVYTPGATDNENDPSAAVVETANPPLLDTPKVTPATGDPLASSNTPEYVLPSVPEAGVEPAPKGPQW